MNNSKPRVHNPVLSCEAVKVTGQETVSHYFTFTSLANQATKAIPQSAVSEANVSGRKTA